MIKTILSILLSATLVSCCKQGTKFFCIDAEIAKALDGDTLTVAFSPDGVSLEHFSTGIVKDGKFHLEGIVDNCTIGYIWSNTPGSNINSLFFIEKGNVRICVDSTSCRITGTPINDRYNTVKDSIAYYLPQLEEFEELYYSIPLDNNELRHLSATGLARQERLIDYLRRTAMENIGNTMGLYMIVAYNELFTTTELCALKESIPHSLVDGGKSPFYNVISDILRERLGF